MKLRDRRAPAFRPTGSEAAQQASRRRRRRARRSAAAPLSAELRNETGEVVGGLGGAVT